MRHFLLFIAKILTGSLFAAWPQRMVPAMFTSASELISRWEELVGSEGSREINVWPELQNFTADVISRTAFGSNYTEGMQIFQLQTEQAELVNKATQTIYIPGLRCIFPSPCMLLFVNVLYFIYLVIYLILGRYKGLKLTHARTLHAALTC